MSQLAYEKKLYTVREVAAQLGVGVKLAVKLLQDGAIPGLLRLGSRNFVRRELFDAWIAGRDGVGV